MATCTIQVILFVFCLVHLSSSAISPLLQQQQQAAQEQENEKEEQKRPWTAADNRDFNYQVQDGINGASAVRQESWRNGTATGSYAQPLGSGLWSIISYAADEKGFRILSTKTVTDADLMHGAQPKHDTVKVESNVNGFEHNYELKADQIKHFEKQKASEQQPQGSLTAQKPLKANASQLHFVSDKNQ